jgi:hypothetical protein
MKTFFKAVFFIIVVTVVIAVAQSLLGFDIIDILGRLLGGTKLSKVHVNVGQESVTPKFEVISLEIFYPSNISVIEISNKEWWRLNVGTVYLFVEYDSYVKLGIRNPDASIRIKRIGDTLYIDESSIVVEILDVKLNNYVYNNTFTSNIFVLKNVSPDFIFQAQNKHEEELKSRMMERGQANFESAKKNFMENYKNLCKGMGLDVVWQ